MEKYTVSRELAQKLKDADYPQNTQFYWHEFKGSGWKVGQGRVEALPDRYVAAPLSDEILEQLPTYIDLPDEVTGVLQLSPLAEGLRCEYLGKHTTRGEVVSYDSLGAMYQIKPADALAELWLWAKENGHIK